MDQYDIQESGTGEDPPLENTYMNLTAITDSTKKGQETPKETTQKDTDAKKSDVCTLLVINSNIEEIKTSIGLGPSTVQLNTFSEQITIACTSF